MHVRKNFFKIVLNYLIFFLFFTCSLLSQNEEDIGIDWVTPSNFTSLNILNNEIVSFVNNEGQPYLYNMEQDSFYKTDYLYIKGVEREDKTESIYYSAYVDNLAIVEKGGSINQLSKVLLDQNLKKVVDFTFKEISFCYGENCLVRGTDRNMYIINVAKKKVITLPKKIRGVTAFANAKYFGTSESTGSFHSMHSLYDYQGSLIHKFNEKDYVVIEGNEEYITVVDGEAKEYEPILSTIDGKAIQPTCVCPNFLSYKNYVICQEEKNACFLNKKGFVKLPVNIVEILPLNEEAVIIKDGEDRYGVINKKGKIMLPLEYNKIGIYTNIERSDYNEFYSFANKKSSALFFDRNMKKIQKTKYDAIGASCKDYIAVQKNNKWGVINKKGKLIISLQYSPKMDFVAFPSGLVLPGFQSFRDCPVLFLPFGSSYLICVYQGLQVNYYDGVGKLLATTENFREEEDLNILLPLYPQNEKDKPSMRAEIRVPLSLLDSFIESDFLAKDIDKYLFNVDLKIKENYYGEGIMNYMKEWLIPPKFGNIRYIGNNLFRVYKRHSWQESTRSGIIRIDE